MVEIKDTQAYLGKVFGDWPPNATYATQENDGKFLKAARSDIGVGRTVYTYVAHGRFAKQTIKYVNTITGEIVLDSPNPIKPNSKCWAVTQEQLYVKID
jgi:hypothetical protein